jgi:hypothetical protein
MEVQRYWLVIVADGIALMHRLSEARLFEHYRVRYNNCGGMAGETSSPAPVLVM